MAKKTNIRSIRFSDELAALIEQQPGNTFTEKFETLVNRCVNELPEKEAELQRIQQQIQDEYAKLKDLWKSTREWRQTLQNVNTRIMSLEVILDQELKLREP